MALRIPNKDALAARQNDAERFVVPGAKARLPRDEISDRWIHVSSLQLDRTGRHGLLPFSSLRMPDDHQVTTGILLADALGDGRLGPAQGAVGAPVLLALHDPSSETACLVVYRRLPLYPHKQTLLPCADMSQRCQNRTRAFVTREAYSITASA